MNIKELEEKRQKQRQELQMLWINNNFGDMVDSVRKKFTMDLNEFRELGGADNAFEIMKYAIEQTSLSTPNAPASYLFAMTKRWLNNGFKSVSDIEKFEAKREQNKLVQSRSRFGQPLRNESPIEKFTPEQIAEQSIRLAKEDGFDDPEEWAKAAMEKFRELRATRAERMADKSNVGFTSSGKRVVTRF
ncbi:hypothetical protein FQP82_03500 [Weissella cibaria]|uniref:hypothetical protein n=1 Tax=Weissella cibaria TaxID=137591 RepID=UPI001193C2CA|nr:hypothetical protein [Weissella cibaria]MBU7560854.1 hypothetical protein [Weissella cibaria]TVV18790.1 hypothetical protein FQP82_03500 [Weissella cibaria]TVV31361.1 hypothetical protein FO434_03550 [Weissella cibaria]